MLQSSGSGHKVARTVHASGSDASAIVDKWNDAIDRILGLSSVKGEDTNTNHLLQPIFQRATTSDCKPHHELFDSTVSLFVAKDKTHRRSLLDDNRFTFGPTYKDLWLLHAPFDIIENGTSQDGNFFEI